ncbi:MAG: hypothetical protein DRP93_01340 [Candidatus Neomarinimicrobiota bacterium]|nr:MAG: hypothetical protein DRP93_01340 [Candidatus Neomarinimicrobiota bacterium]
MARNNMPSAPRFGSPKDFGAMGFGIADAGKTLGNYGQSKLDDAYRGEVFDERTKQNNISNILNRDKHNLNVSEFGERKKQNKAGNVSIQTDMYGDPFIFDRANPSGSGALGYIAGIESGGTKDPYTAKNPASSAYGKYQVIDDTNNTVANRLGITPAQARTPQGQEAVGKNLETEYRQQLKGLGLQDTQENMLTIHQLGYPRAKRVFQGNATPEDMELMKTSTPIQHKRASRGRVNPKNMTYKTGQNGEILEINKRTGEVRSLGNYGNNTGQTSTQKDIAAVYGYGTPEYKAALGEVVESQRRGTIADTKLKQHKQKAAKDKSNNELLETITGYKNAAQSSQDAINTLEKIKKHPGTAGAVGMSSPMSWIPGTDWKDASALIEQFNSQAFVSEVQKLRGLGALSDSEGKKLASAVANLDIAQSEEGFMQNLNTAISTLSRARDNSMNSLEAKQQEMGIQKSTMSTSDAESLVKSRLGL